MEETENPVSNELRESILAVLRNRMKTEGKKKGVVNIISGPNPGEIVYVMREMNISCMALEDSAYFYFDWPSGRRHRALKDKFLSELSTKLAF